MSRKAQTARRGRGIGTRLATAAAVLLVLIGLGLILYPTVSDLRYRWRVQEEIKAYSQLDGVDCDALFAQAEAYNQALAQKEDQFQMSESERAYVETLLNPLGTGMMGYLEIPKLHISLPIFQGTEDNALQEGVGWWIGTSLPTGGPSTHCVLTAHTGLVEAKLFTDLDQMEEGDQFTLFILDRELTYEVDQILVTEPSQWEPLSIVEGEDYVTLYTCTPYGVNTHRLLVRGHRIETPAQAPEAALGWQTVLPPAVLALLILAALVWIIRHKRSSGGGPAAGPTGKGGIGNHV